VSGKCVPDISCNPDCDYCPPGSYKDSGLVLNVHKIVLIVMLQSVSNVLMVSTMMLELVELVKVIV